MSMKIHHNGIKLMLKTMYLKYSVDLIEVEDSNVSDREIFHSVTVQSTLEYLERNH